VISASVYVDGALGCAFSLNAPMLIGFRFLLGVSVGTASFVAPLYISEVSPPKVRGGLVHELTLTGDDRMRVAGALQTLQSGRMRPV